MDENGKMDKHFAYDIWQERLKNLANKSLTDTPIPYYKADEVAELAKRVLPWIKTGAYGYSGRKQKEELEITQKTLIAELEQIVKSSGTKGA